MNTNTGEASWSKPANMGSDDIPDPPDRWERLTDAEGNVYYYHAKTGRTSWMSESDAAKLVQRLYRKSKANDFRIKDFMQIVRALKFQRDAEDNYKKFPDRLSSVANFALLMHTRDHDYKAARKLYEKAFEIAPQNPVLLWAWTIFLLAENAHPRKLTWEAAQAALVQAKVYDEKAEKFEVAKTSFFHWAVVVGPSDSQSLLNWALVQQ